MTNQKLLHKVCKVCLKDKTRANYGYYKNGGILPYCNDISCKKIYGSRRFKLHKEKHPEAYVPKRTKEEILTRVRLVFSNWVKTGVIA